MYKSITIRQFIFLYLFISITPILSYIPKIAADNGGRGAYISAIYIGLILCIFAGLIYEIIRVYPKQGFFEILSDIFGSIIARIIFCLYAIWAFFFLIFKTSSYSLLIQTTLSPKINPLIILAFLFLLALYAIQKGGKTVFRFAEFLYIPFVLFLALLFFLALPNINKTYLVPITINHFDDNVYSLGPLCAVGGNLFLILFFAKSFTNKSNLHKIRCSIFPGILGFTLLTFCSIFITLGISGPALTAKFNYSVFQTIKSISVLNTFDRFDAFITIICVFSDFIAICTFLIICVQCIMQAFSVKHGKGIGIFVLVVVCTLTAIFDISQFEIENTYRVLMDTLNIIFQYFIPVVLGVICLFKSPKKEESA